MLHERLINFLWFILFVASCVVVSLFFIGWPVQSLMLLVWCKRQEKKEKKKFPSLSFLQRKNNTVVKTTVENSGSSILF